MMEIVHMLTPWWVCLILLIAVILLFWARLKWRAWRDEVRQYDKDFRDWITANCPGCQYDGAPTMPQDPGWPA